MKSSELEFPQDECKINEKKILFFSILYFIAVIWIVVFKCNQNEYLCIEANKKLPLLERFLYDIKFDITDAMKLSFKNGSTIEIIALFFNVLGFVPLGIAIRYLSRRILAILWSFLMVLSIETFQALSYIGGIQISDIILNVLGCFIGIIIYDTLLEKAPAQTVNNVSAVLIYLLIPADIFFVINTVINWPWA